MGIAKKITTEITCVCDRCKVIDTWTIQEGNIPQARPIGWACISIDGLPAPAVHQMAKALGGSDEWDDNGPVMMPLALPSAPVERYFCASCLVDLWNFIGLPEQLPKDIFLTEGEVRAVRSQMQQYAATNAPYGGAPPRRP